MDQIDKKDSITGYVDAIIKEAVSKSASDIHIEPLSDTARIRFRVDGMLYDQSPIDDSKKLQVVSRIKVLSNIDISERRVPQDGKFRIAVDGSDIDFRVSTFPSIYGEKVVVRILDRSKTMIQLDALGFSKSMLAQFISLIENPSGFILVTGPTGSGKTTTLYAALSHLNNPQKNIITLEDPVEYNLDGITQGQIHPDAGFTFERGMRSLLRQDPDIAMVGEIRDKQTAQIAIEAALTGHVVFSTLHTNDSPGAVMRLMDMNIEPFLINAALSGVLAQRLVRKICDNCKEVHPPNVREKKMLEALLIKMDRVYRGKGCDECFGSGYKGRVGIFELLTMSPDLRSLVVQYPKFDDIKAQAIADGTKTMISDGMEKVKKGIVSLDEIFRVIW